MLLSLREAEKMWHSRVLAQEQIRKVLTIYSKQIVNASFQVLITK